MNMRSTLQRMRPKHEIRPKYDGISPQTVLNLIIMEVHAYFVGEAMVGVSSLRTPSSVHKIHASASPCHSMQMNACTIGTMGCLLTCA